MTEFTSEIKILPHNDTEVFSVLSDLSNLEFVKDKIPQDKIKDFSFDKDSCTISVDPVGKIKFNIIERVANSTVKFQAEQVPFGLDLIVELNNNGENKTELKLTVNANLNPFIKPMVSKPLQQGLEKMAEALAMLPYSEIAKMGTQE